MDVQLRADLGIGYYYESKDGRIVYIPIERGKGALESWLKKQETPWWKVMLYEDFRNTPV